MKKTDANTFIEVLCHCPYCNSLEDIFALDRVKEIMDENHSAKNCELEITCRECKKVFIVENICF